MPSGVSSLRWRPTARQQRGEFVAAGGSGLQHGPVDVAFDGAYGDSQALGDFAVGQSLTDQHHDLAFAIGERQWLAGLPKRWGTGPTALFGQGLRACRGSQRGSPEVLAAIRERSMGCRIDGGDEITHPLEFIGHGGQFSGFSVAQGGGEPCGHAYSGPFDHRFELVQSSGTGAITELGSILKA